jgi:hypothetical protein
MPIDVAVQEPRAGVVSLEADANLAASNADDVTAGRVHKVKSSIHALNNIEGVTVQMEGMD